MTEDTKFLDPTTFQLRIEEVVRIKKVNHMEAVILFCVENNLEFEDIKKIVTSNLKDKIKIAAIEDGYMKKEAQLPL